MADLNGVHQLVRALLEGERIGLQDVQRRGKQSQRERVIEIKMPDQPYTPRTSILTPRQHTNIRYTPPAFDFRKSPALPSASKSPSRVVPISVTERTRHQSPASRRDMVSFTKARAANSITADSTTTIKDTQTGWRENQTSPSVQTSVKSKLVSHERSHVSSSQSPTTETDSVKVASPPSTGFSAKTGSQNYSSEEQENTVHDELKDTSATGPSETKLLDSVSLEEIIEKVIKPAGLEAKVCSSGESQVRYHVETIEQEDGTAKTQIVLESKVEEELDVTKESSLDELLKQGTKKVSLEDIKDTETGSMIRNLLKGLQGGDDLQSKSFSVEIIEDPAQPQSDNRLETEQMVASAFNEPPTYFQIEELENVICTRDEDALRSYTPDTDPSHSGFEEIQEVSRESESSQLSQDLHEYFVSTPDENFSDAEEASRITSYGRYGIVDDLSDEKYYQDEALPQRRVTVQESEHKFLSGDLLGKESFPECIIEEEVRVSPIVQESVLEYLREDSLEPKEQLKGALEKLQSSVSGPLKEELAFFTKMTNESPENVAVDIKKVQQSSDNGTTTIVAELNVSQTLEDSGLLDTGDDLSDEQLLAALRSSNLGFDEAFQGGAGAGYSIRVSTEGHGFGDKGESVYEITEKSLKSQLQSGSSAEKPEEELETKLKVHQEKKIATILLESPSDV
uniref:Synemin n=1 Tax=Gouania willdenowi TaxID=441366 RepID=A0A8C5DRP8_GOUWI